MLTVKELTLNCCLGSSLAWHSLMHCQTHPLQGLAFLHSKELRLADLPALAGFLLNVAPPPTLPILTSLLGPLLSCHYRVHH